MQEHPDQYVFQCDFRGLSPLSRWAAMPSLSRNANLSVRFGKMHLCTVGKGTRKWGTTVSKFNAFRDFMGLLLGGGKRREILLWDNASLRRATLLK